MTAETFAIGVPDVTDETARNVPGTNPRIRVVL